MSSAPLPASAGQVEAPLAGIRVVDLAQFVAGSYCTQLLGDLGADVIKVELPGAGDPYRAQGPEFVGDEATLFLALNRNKRSICIDWKRSEGRAVLERVISGADVFVQNARPGTLERCGLDGETLTRRHGRLVYCGISGYGQTGPYAERGGFDLILQAEAGIMSVTGEADRPPVKVGAPLLDIGAALAAVLGISSALLQRERTGRGGLVESSLLDFSLALLTTSAQSYFATGVEPARMGSASPQFAPYQAFEVGSEYLVVAGSGNERLWEKLCVAIGRGDLAADPRFRTNALRVARQEELAEIIEAALAARTRDEWLAKFAAAGIPAGPINGLGALLSDPHVLARGSTVSYRHPSVGEVHGVAAPVRLAGRALPVRRAPPRPGEHTEEALTEAGFEPAELSELRSAGVIS